jgi:addiction module HigA family antidote
MQGQSSTGGGNGRREPERALREAMQARGWSTEQLAWVLGYSTTFVESMLDKTVFTPEMALRLEAALGVKAEIWMDVQRDGDLWCLRERMGGEMMIIQRRSLRADLLEERP